MVVFLDDDEIPKIMEVGKLEQWEMFRAKDVSEIVTKSEGLLILRSLEGRGLNTPFLITARVLIGTDIEDESEHVQKTGRSCRTRGINHSEYYFDKWPNEAAVRTFWKKKAFTRS